MDSDLCKLFESLIPATYVKQAEDAANARRNTIRNFLQHKKIPETGWDKSLIEKFLSDLSLMDSNNFPSKSGIGEREARFASELVAQRHYNFGHGIGRSGDLTGTQPKAAGSSILYKLTNSMLKDLMKIMGILDPVECLMVPVATGMSLVLCMLTFRSMRPKAQYVLWFRVDQKTCFKSILAVGLTPVIINMVKRNNELVSDCGMLVEKIKEIGPDNVNCILSTTSCFAPRSCDNLDIIAEICRQHDIPHLINNAYGLQSQFLVKRIQRAQTKGRVDLFVQSSDKNFMVPVGGAIIASFDKTMLDAVSKMYPGRASSSPIVDVFITLLTIGASGYLNLVKAREEHYILLKEHMNTLAAKYGEEVIENSENPISLALTLTKVPEQHLTQAGSMLFLRKVFGSRVVTTSESKTIGNFTFKGWGAHYDEYGTPYITAAAALGVDADDINIFIEKLDNLLSVLIKS